MFAQTVPFSILLIFSSSRHCGWRAGSNTCNIVRQHTFFIRTLCFCWDSSFLKFSLFAPIFSYFCQNPNLTSTQRLGFTWKWLYNHHPPTHTISMSGISQLLLTWFWQNLNGTLLGTSRTHSKYHCDICLGIICPGDICPYQENLGCYWLDFEETLKVGSWEYLEQIPTVTVTFIQATFILVTFVHIRNILAVTDPILAKP